MVITVTPIVVTAIVIALAVAVAAAVAATIVGNVTPIGVTVVACRFPDNIK